MKKKIYQSPSTEVTKFDMSGDLLDWNASFEEGGPGILEGKQDICYDDNEWTEEEDIIINFNVWE